VILLVMSFTGAGIIGLKNGIGMILGANLGTTVTGWIVALLGFKINPESFYLPVTAIGSIGFIFSSNGRINKVSKLLFGFGLMFMGLHFMKDGFMDFAQKVDLRILEGKPYFLFLLFGFVLAAAIRSSAASMMIFITSLASGSIDLMQAGFLAIGADLGTTITGLLGTINGNHIRKKTGWSQFYINVFTAIFTIILIKPLFGIIAYAGIKDPLVALVTFHSTFNLMGIVLILPFLGKLTDLLDKYISDDQPDNARFLPYINSKDVLSSLDALEAETLLFIKKASEIRKIFFVYTKGKTPTEQYYDLKTYENEIFNLSAMFMQNKLSAAEAEKIQNLYSSIRSATLAVKDIKDIIHNMDEFKQSVNDEVFEMFENIMESEKIFHNEFEVLIQSNVNGEIMEDLILQNEKNYTNIKAHAFKLYNKYMDIDLASLLNMVREMRDSRKLILTAYQQYCGSLMVNKN
ncbi:MAG: Na/Pi symporter, partial [Saprospiraceae bacterium]